MARRRNSNSGVYSKKDYMNRQENKGVYSRDDYMRQRATRIDPARVNDIQEGAEALRLDIMRRQQSQAMTNAWQNMSQQATYRPAGDQRGLAYAEKMKYDTMGRDAYLQDLENQRRNQQTYMTQRQPVEELQAEKRWRKEQARREQEQKEWDAYVQAQYNTSHDAMRDVKKETGGSSTGAPLTIKDFQEWRARQQADRESGALDKGNDPWNVSDKGLPDWIKRNQKAEEEYSKTPGQLWADVLEYADDVKANRELRQRPADYTDSRDVYDKYLYNSINGEGAYEKRADEIETDADADALDAELDELWARYERGELPKYIRNINDSELYDSVNGEGAYNKRLNEISTFGVPKKINEGSEALSREMDDLWGQYDRGALTDENAAALAEERENNRIKNTDAGDKYFDFGTDYNDWASMTPEKRRETLWMEMMGTDYAAALEGMTDAQKAEMNRRMDLIMDKAMQGNTKDFNAAADAYKNLVKQGETAQEYRNTIKDLDIQAQGLEAQGYTGADVPAMLEANKPKYVSDPEDTEGMLRLDRIWSNTEKAMYLMNYKKNLDGTGDLYSDANKYMFANEDQIKQANIFYEYDQKNGTHMTEAFLEGIDSYLTSELAKYQEEYARSLADDAFRGSVARVASYAAKPITGLLGTAGTILNTLGVEGAQDTTGDFFKYDKLINVLREQGNENAADWTAKTFGEEWRDRTTFALGVVDSIADNLMAMAVGSKLAGVSAATRTEQNIERSMRLVQLIMSAEATSATMIEKLDSGMDGTEAAVYSVGDGIIEWLTERYSLEQILKPDVKAMLGKPKQLISFLVKSSAAEGSEEIASDLLNLGLDSVVSYIAGHEDEIRQRVNDYIVNEHMTAREAEKRVLQEKLGEIAQSGLAGAMSGLGMAGGRTVANKFNQVQTGRNVRAEENGLQKIIDLAKGMEEGTESRALAEKLAGQKKVNNGDLGKLSQLIITESSEERGEVIRGTVYRNVAEDLKAEGVENASEAAEVITRNLTEGNEKLSRADMKVLAQSEGAINVWKDYNTTESLSNAKTKLDIASRTQNINSVMEQAEDLSSPIRTATGKLSEDIMRSVKSTASTAEAIDDFQQRRSWLMSESYAQLAKDLLESDKSTQKSKNYLDDVMKIRLAGMTLAKEMPQTQLEDAAARALFNAAREEFNEADKGRLRNQVQVIPGKGTANILGAQYGTDAWDDKLNELKVTRDQRQQLKAMAEIAVRMGNKLEVFNDADRTDVYGFEDSTGTVHINLAGLNGNKMSHHMLVTMSHELTHWLEQNSWEGYNQLRSFILDSLRSKGESIEDMIIDAINNQNKAIGAKSGQVLQITDAMKEIVAKSCENLLSSKALEAELRKTNPELHGKIRNFVKKFIARLRAAVQGMTGSLSKAARTLYNETEEIAKLWLGARQEALSRTATGPLAEAGPEGVSFSTADDAEDRQIKLQVNSHIDELMELEPVADISSNIDLSKYYENGARSISAAYKAWANDLMKKINYQVNRENFGTVEITKSRIRTGFGYAMNNKAKAAFAAVPDIIQKGELINEHENHKGNAEIQSATLAGKIMLDGKPQIMAVVVTYTKDTHRYKTHKVFMPDGTVLTIEKEASARNAEDVKSQGLPIRHASDDNITQEADESKRYSTAELDEEYSKAIESGDTARQQELVDQAARDNGYTLKVYHGTPTGGFTQFKDWSYFTEKKEYADRYNHPSASSIRGYAVESSQPMTYALYMNPGRVFDTRNKKVEALYNKARMEYGMGELTDNGLPDWTDGRDIIDYIEENDLPYDTIILNEGADGGYGAPVVSRGVSYVTRANMVKSAEPITRYNNGDVVPLSKRFNKQEKDIRFSIAEPVEQRADGLIAVHNLRESELLSTIKEGGLTAPSIAVIKAAQGHTKYGRVSVVFYPSAIDPRRTARNKVYGADAYTPTRYDARVEQEIVSKEVEKASEGLHNLLKGEHEELDHELTNWLNDKLYGNDTDKTLTDIVSTGYNNSGLLAAYQKEKGNDVDVKMTEVVTSRATPDNVAAYDDLIDKLHARNMLEDFLADYKELSENELVDKYGPAFKEILSERHERFKKLDITEGMGRRVIRNWFMQLTDYLYKGITKESRFDRFGTREALQAKTNEDDFIDWLSRKLSNVLGQKGIRNNKDTFTDIGNRRSFKQLHDEYTAENVVRAMYKNAPRKGVHADYFKGLMATASKEYRSLAEIKRDAGRLGIISEDEYEKYIEEKNREMDAIGREIIGDEDYRLNDVRRVFVEAGNRYAVNQSIGTIKNAFKAEGYTLTDETAEKVKNLMDEAREFATGYFEAKPERLMGFDEIAKVVLPADADPQLITALEQNGIDYETYDGTDADRLEKVNSIEGVQFSTQESPDMEVNNFMMGLQEFNMPTNQEKTMLRQYKDLHMSLGITQMKIQDYEKKLRELRAIENPSVYDRDQIRITEQRIKTNKNRLERLRNDMVRATKDKGYARQMMKNDSLMKNLVNGVTADQMITVVQNMMKQLEELNSEMQERAKKLQELGENATVLQIRQQFNRQGLKRIAAQLKEQMNSEADNREIENRLALIALKMKEGKFDKETTEELVDMILGNMRGGLDTYVLNELRGERIALSPAQLKELKAKNSSIRELNAQLAGTGIMFTASGETNLEHKWKDLCKRITSLNKEENNLHMVDAIMKLIRDEMDRVFEDRFNDANVQGTTEMVLKAAAQLVPEIVTDAKSLNLIKETMQYAAQVAEQAKGTAAEVFDIDKAVERIKNTGRKVESTASTLTGDLKTAMAYFNDLSEQSEAALWKRERLALIDQLKSENTMELLVEREKWRQKIEKDQKAREQMQSNMHLRKQIHTNFTRLRKLLINETDQKNIPEHMKGLAREMLRLITDNDLSGRKLTGMDPKDLLETRRVLDAMQQLDGEFTADDLRLINDEEAQAAVLDALADIEDGIGFYNNKLGKDIISNLQGLHNALQRISDGVSTISSVISAERSISFLNRRMDVADAAEDVKRGMANSRFKGELSGRGRKAIDATKSAVFYGNMTPVYYFKMLRNGGMDAIWEDIQEGENRNGLETAKAKVFLEQLAEKTGYKDWAEEKKEVILGGRKVTVTIDNMMELYAIWQREHTTNPEMSQHLAKGGVYIQDEEEDTGRLRRERKEQRPIRITDEEIGAIYGQLTDQQKEYMESIVRYLSNDMSDLGNKASMRMYGIKKYKETYYFPMKVWDGVKSARSDKGITGTDENRMAHKSWSKRRMHNAQNALVIGSFTKDAVNHIVEMINYNTMAPGIENMNKILNYQFTEGMEEEETKRNLRVMFQEAYGREALKYLETFMKDMNGGVAQDQRKTLRDKALTIFKKNAVAGSLSVVLQQPLSYIRAAMIINPKYMATAPVRENWKDSYREMMAHSGVAVIKDMGRFDMNFGQSAKDFITPETRKTALEKISDATTIAPQLADRMTWIWMWNAVKAEQADQHKGMDVKSDKFLDIVGKRFNQVMRETQVYDSILVKSSNMRSQNFGMKLITSFMAEPTLSLNVLADAVGRVRAGDEKSVQHAIKAGATFMLSAILQAVFKGLMGSGRTPDEKKTWLENFLNKFEYNLINEANPLSLIPGYSDLIEVLKTGELKDDAMGAIGKLLSIVQTTQKAIQGKGKGWYRDIEDTAAQLAQLFTNIPAKNLMRDARAVFNLIFQGNYAKRPTSGAVRKYQLEANIFNADSILGTVNTWLGDAGFKTSNKAYYSRMYEAQKAGNQAEVDSIKEYLTLGKGVEEKTIQSGIRALAKNDNSLSAEDRIKAYADNSTDKGGSNFIIAQLKAGEITDLQARKMIKEIFPEKTDNDIYWQVDRAKYQAETGKEKISGNYYRLEDAINANRANQIQEAVTELLKHGVTKEKIKSKLSDWKSEYLAADSTGKIRIRDAITKAYKAAGYTAADAQKTIDGWSKERKKNNK